MNPLKSIISKLYSLNSLLFLIIPVIIIACSNNNLGSSKNNVKFAHEVFQKQVGHLVNDKFVIDLPAQEIMDMYVKYNNSLNRDYVGSKFEIITGQEGNFFRFYNKDGSATTFELNKQIGGYVINSTISCTTKTCSNTSGCIPSLGNKCSKCTGDCEKTVTADLSSVSE